MPQSLPSPYPTLRIRIQHPRQQIISIPIHLLILRPNQLKITCSILRQYLRILLTLKHRFPRQQVMEYQPRREYIRNWVAMCRHVLYVDDLGSDETWRPASNE